MQLNEAVANKIGAAGPTIKETLIDSLASVEIKRRTDLLIKAMGRQNTMEKELLKINRPDVTTYNAAGEKIETTSQKRFDEVKKAKENLGKLEKLIELCLEQNKADDYNKLSQLSSGGDKPEGKSETGEQA